MRVLVDVEPREGAWGVSITLPDGTKMPKRAMARLPEAPFVGPADEAESAGQPHAELVGESGRAARKELIQHIARRQVSDRDLRFYGRYLFDSLIGHGAWQRLCGSCQEGGTLEVALRWAAGEHDLHAPLWEAMHDGNRFLSAYGSCAIAITRVIADAGATATPITSAPRILFPVGADLADPAIRPGAEFMGVLRAVRSSGNPLIPFVLQQASLRSIAQAVVKFKPDAVHLICHGRLVGGEPRLILIPDDVTAAVTEVPVSPEQVYAGLAGAGGRVPQITVLSACETGAGGIAERAGSESATPFAVGLVRAGVPIVVAMSGRVADTACRLFSRRFAEALTNGEELVAAVANGRRAAYIETDTPTTIDWLLPAVFLSAEVEAGYAPVQADAGRLLRERLAEFGLAPSLPVFCGRHHFFDAYERLVDPNDGLSTVFAYWQEPKGVGKDRLMSELAARALTDGHVPVIVKQADGWPRTPTQAGVQFGIAIDDARKHLGLDSATSSFLELATAVIGYPQSAPTSRATLRAALAEIKARDEAQPEGVGIAGGIADAVHEDLARLAADARAAGLLEPTATLFIVLADVDEWDKGRAMVLDELLGTTGLRIGGAKVPVAGTWKSSGAAGESLEEERRESQGQAWKMFIKLARFKDQEELLAYQWVLLHPRKAEDQNGSGSGKVWVVQEPDGRWVDQFREHIQGLPGNFVTPMFEVLAYWMTDIHEFALADDERVLHDYTTRQAAV